MSAELPREMPDLGPRFRAERLLGRGGTAEVWLVLDTELDEHVVAKMLPETADEAAFETLRRECRRARRLRHPSIVPVYDVHRVDEHRFSVQAHIEAESSGELLRGGDPVRILSVALELVDALEYAHEQGIVHRDLKAANVLIDGAGKAHLLDFGLSAEVGGGASEDGEGGGGSEFSMSPQQLDGEPSRVEDDIYGLGAWLYDLLSGRPPLWPEATPEAIRHREPEALSAASGAALPEGLVTLVASMLAKKAEERPGLSAVRSTLRVSKERLESGRQAAPKLVPPPRAAATQAGPALRPPRSAAPSLLAPPTSTSAPLGGSARGPEPFLPSRGRGSGIGIGTVVGFSALALLAVAVFALLPGWVNDGSTTEGGSQAMLASDAALPGAGAAEGTGSGGEGSGLASDEPSVELDPEVRRQQAAERLQARRVLEALAGRLQNLEERAVAEWGGPAWNRASRLIEDGRLRFEGRDWAGAMATWDEAGDAVGDLETRLPQVRDGALDDGDTALADGRINAAEAAYNLALTLDPSSARARQGLSRARAWHDVQALLDDGRERESRGEFAAARNAYDRALKLDSASSEARRGVARMSSRLADNAFSRAMSRGFEALEEERWSAARDAFRAAAKLRPGVATAEQAVADALSRVDSAETVWKIAGLRKEGQRLEQAEDWRGAADSYSGVLAIDASVSFALEGKERANARAELAERMAFHLDNVDRLGDATVLDEVSRLVDRARTVEPAGPVHHSQIEKLDALIAGFSVPQAVSLRSDGLTEVVVYRVGKLGTFQDRHLELRPGKYTVVGTRPGYRDVRLELLVQPGQSPEILDIRCTETI